MKWIAWMGPLGKTTLVFVIYSLLVLVLAFHLGIHASDTVAIDHLQDVRFFGYIAKYNWSLFFLWWLFLAALVYLTWEPFLAAWKDMQRQQMLRDSSGKPASVGQVERLCLQMGRYRRVLLVIATLISFAITYVDTTGLRNIYQACPEGYQESGLESCKNVIRRLAAEEVEADFNIAFLIPDKSTPEAGDKLISRSTNVWVNYVTYFQQVVGGIYAVLATLQLALICNLFWRLERARWLNPEGLQMRLDPYSRLHEFGLERWNHAWNNVYWVFSLVLLIAIASKESQTVGELDPGQLVLQYVVPGLIAAPMVATIIARQQRLPDLWQQVREEEDPDKADLYHKQLVWPLDRNWASKLGIIVSFVLLTYLLGTNILKLAS